MAASSLSFLTAQPQEAREEDEETVDSVEEDWTASDLLCASCNEVLHFTEEIFHVSVFYAIKSDTEMIVTPVVYQDGEHEGDYYYEPLFFEFSCWEDVMEELREMVENAPPVTHAKELFECNFCECSICEFEYFGTAYVGELRISKRMPSGRAVPYFDTVAKPFIFCIGCLNLINDHTIDLWDETITQTGECQECTHIRCWRERNCSCPCHDG